MTPSSASSRSMGIGNENHPHTFPLSYDMIIWSGRGVFMLCCSWASIAAHLPGLTDNDVKNRWYNHLKKKKIGRSIPTKEHWGSATCHTTLSSQPQYWSEHKLYTGFSLTINRQLLAHFWIRIPRICRGISYEWWWDYPSLFRGRLLLSLGFPDRFQPHWRASSGQLKKSPDFGLLEYIYIYILFLLVIMHKFHI